MWMLLVLFYGIIKGIREICKKKALEKNGIIEVLLVYTFMSVLLVVPQAPKSMGLSSIQYFWIAVKAFVIFVAWIAGFKAIKKLPISIYGILDLSRVIFATLLGIFVLGELPTVNKTIGLIFVSLGLLFLKFNPFKNKEKELSCDSINSTVNIEETNIKTNFSNKTWWFVFLAFLSCVLNAVSGLLDKILMKEMNSSQLQFWYTVFMFFYYLIYAIIRRVKIDKNIWKNIWVWLLAILLVLMDKALFIANGMEGSQITIMTLIKQSSVLVAIIAGKFVFKEKNILHKVICAAIIVTGIIIGVC